MVWLTPFFRLGPLFLLGSPTDSSFPIDKNQFDGQTVVSVASSRLGLHQHEQYYFEVTNNWMEATTRRRSSSCDNKKSDHETTSPDRPSTQLAYIFAYIFARWLFIVETKSRTFGTTRIRRCSTTALLFMTMTFLLGLLTHSATALPYMILTSTRSKCMSVIAPQGQTITIDYTTPGTYVLGERRA
jgi:hypothetical protein